MSTLKISPGFSQTQQFHSFNNLSSEESDDEDDIKKFALKSVRK
jgi:hypothetical protein